jgi:hypothetical protein
VKNDVGPTPVHHRFDLVGAAHVGRLPPNALAIRRLRGVAQDREIDLIAAVQQRLHQPATDEPTATRDECAH